MPDRRRSALIVFAKEPVPGQVKTRLTPALTADEAAELYRAFLADAAVQYGELDCDILYFIAPPKAGRAAGDPLPVAANSEQFLQCGDALGDRMHDAFLEAFSRGYEQVVVIGTDHPTLPTDYIRQAFSHVASDRESVVLGPSSDGGYYLLGLGAPVAELFDGMEYSHSKVFAQTVRRVSGSELRLVTLPEWTDVDTPEALINLVGELRGSRGLPDFPVHTADIVERLCKEHPWLEGGRDPSINNETV